MGTLKKFDRLALMLVAMTVVFLLPEIAWAGAPGQGIINMIWKTISRFGMNYLIPHEQHKILSIICVVLTMVALLWHPKAKAMVGRFSGIPMAFLGLILAYQIAMSIPGTIWSSLSGLWRVVLVIVVVLSIGSIITLVIGTAKGVITGLVGFAKRTLMGENPSEVFCWIGALFIAGFINSSYISNPENYYAPSWVASAIGLGLIIHKILKNPVAKKFHKRKHGLTTTGDVVCPNDIPVTKRDGSPKLNKLGNPKYSHCAFDGNKPNTSRCDKCGGELRQISWDCECGAKKIPHERAKCPACSKERPPILLIPGILGIPPWEAEKRMKKGVQTCPHCQTELGLHAKYCKKCKKDVRKPDDSQTAPAGTSAPARRTAPPAGTVTAPAPADNNVREANESPSVKSDSEVIDDFLDVL